MSTTPTPATVDPRAALDTAIDAARLASPEINLLDGRSFAFVPNGYSLNETTSPDRLRDHVRAATVMDDRTSLIGYVNRFSDARSILFADYDASTIKACLDWHHANDAETPLAPQQAAHGAVLRIRQSEEFARWSAMEGDMHSQAEFALFIEENVFDISDPDHAQIIEVCRDLEASQDSSFKSRTRLENGDMAFKYETDTRVTNSVVVPNEIGLSIPLYHGEAPTEIRAKFRFRVSGGGLLLGFKWHRVEYQRQAKFREMAFDASEQTGRPVYFGRT